MAWFHRATEHFSKAANNIHAKLLSLVLSFAALARQGITSMDSYLDRHTFCKTKIKRRIRTVQTESRRFLGNG